jgi:hypothetical protein
LVERGSGGKASLSLYGSSVKGTWREGSLAGDPEGEVEKALEIGISFHGGPFMSEGNLESGGGLVYRRL